MERESGLAQLFGNTPVVQVLDVLIDHPVLGYAKKDVVEVTDVEESTLAEVWPRLEALDIVEETRVREGMQLYQLNMESPVVERLVRLDQAVQKTSEEEAAECFF